MSETSDRIRRALDAATTEYDGTTSPARRLEILETIIAALPTPMQVDIAWCAATLERLLEAYPPAVAGMALTVVEARLVSRVLGERR
jgi:hypothetical protein